MSRMSQTVLSWYVPEMRKDKEARLGINVPDHILMWVITDCRHCSERDKKIAKIILDARLAELEDLY